MNKIISLFISVLFFNIAFASCQTESDISTPVVTKFKKDVDVFVTMANGSMRFDSVPLAFSTKPNMAVETTITMNPNQVFQQIDGFGAAITGSSCYNLLKMSQANRTKLLKETFDPVSGMGYSYIRISIGCSDFSLDEYTCCDTPGIENFAIHDLDKRDLFPILKEILAINPNVKILASPWTCPRWMKVNNLTDKKPFNSWTSGQLNPDYYLDYATYFVKFVQAMGAEGFKIDALTIQNEPLNRGNSVSLYMSWQEQAAFVKNALGPKFSEAGLTTKIVVFDHNYNYDNISDQLNYPVKIYSDPVAAQYVDGAAYHAYGGDKSEMMNVHNAFPSKNLYFTEMSIGTWNYPASGDLTELMWSMKEIGIGSLNNYCKAVIVWNYMLDENRAPNRPGGCTTCYGAVDISTKDYATLDRKSHFYLIGHLSKAISPGAKRIGTTGFQTSGLYYTAVENTDGTYGLVMQNDTNSSLKITLADATHSFAFTIPAKSVASYRWKK
ncbi:MAG: glycoside hydrolase family 30 beta sandwich domain-containing protein [Bacteroidales bacterium]|nr:glycoside hydrolase family 30 beta sandwich domain-containing protein [Bacteroidales bacterium]